MSASGFLRIWTWFFIGAFFLYLFGPLLIMGISAFNSSSFPRATPFECLTGEWFVQLSRDEKTLRGLWRSLVIGACVVAVSVPIGLAGAILLTQVHAKLRPVLYCIAISPILVPGVVLGISTLIFWDRLGTIFGADYSSIFYDGIFLTVVGQSTFISAYCMLIFLARLQRFDTTLEEAALDLGANNLQTFTKILLPFLSPAMASAAVLAFLASFENYNTTVFTMTQGQTLTTVLASKVRYGLNPSISALAVIIVALTLVGAIVYELMRRRELQPAGAGPGAGPRTGALPGASASDRAGLASKIGNPAVILMVLIAVAGLGMGSLLAFNETEACKARVLEEKLLLQQRRVIPEIQYRDIFNPESLLGTQELKAIPQQTDQGATGDKQYQGIFDPGNLTAPSNTDTGNTDPGDTDPGDTDPGDTE